MLVTCPAPPASAATLKPRVAEAVEHLGKTQALRVLVQGQAAVALVEVITCLVSLGDVQSQAPAVFQQLERRIAAAAQPAGGLGQAFELAAAGVGTLVQARATGDFDQRVGDRSLPALHTTGGELRHQRVAIAVHDQARQAVGLTVHQANAVALDAQPRAQGDGARECVTEKGSVDALGLIEAPGPHADA
jgi:hypothetical protein